MNASDNYNDLLRLIRASLWGAELGMAGQKEYDEMKQQALQTLPADIIAFLDLPEDIFHSWKNDIRWSVINNTRYQYEQSRIPISVPYVILKGTAAAQYYPHPEYRTMGDIDIMTGRDDYDTACEILLQNGYEELTNNHQEEFGRHRSYAKNGIVIEVHAFFALLNDPEQAKYMDDLIVANINPSHILPDLINGLVLLEHINQHFEEGLGLRQIIDWMMFVDKCLPDEQWPDFRIMAQRVGLEQLAVITTRMCELYLGLPSHMWCRGADEKLCEKLLEYVISSGNFGNKRNDASCVTTNLFTYARTPAAFFRLLQERGMVNWTAAREHKILRPFAWIYQLARYNRLSRKRQDAFTKIKKDYNSAKERIALFDALGVKQISKGLAVYEEGRYVKTYRRP